MHTTRDPRHHARAVALFRRAVRLLLGCGALHAEAKERPAEPLARVLFETAAEFSLDLVAAVNRARPLEAGGPALDRAGAMLAALAALAELAPDLTFESERLRFDLEEIVRAVAPAPAAAALRAA